MTHGVARSRHDTTKAGWGGALWIAVLAAIVASAACGGSEDAGPAVRETGAGAVIEVEAASLLEVDSLSVMDDSGVVWRFVGREFRGFSPSHLNEHRVQGDRVTVTFRRDGDTLVIENISD